MGAVLIVSADGHVGPNEEAYRDFLEPRYREAFDDYMRVRTPVSLADLNEPDALARHLQQWVDTGKATSMGNSDKRIEVLAAEGAVAEVLFPDKTRDDEIPFSDAPYPGCSTELRVAGERAYNRWLASYCEPHATRLAGLASLTTFDDIDATLAELAWVADQPGLRGAMLPGVGPDRGDWLDPSYERVWSTCEETGLVVHFHVGAGAPPKGGPHYPHTRAGGMIATFEGWFWAQRALWWLIYGGVLERHPTLRVVFTETGSAWVAEKLATMDWFTGVPYKLKAANIVVPRTPSEYFRRQCAVGSSIMSLEDLRRRHAIGVDNMMFGLDVPHLEGTASITLPYLQRTFGALGVPEHEARAILGENAVRIYGFDHEELEAAAAGVGPAIDDVLRPPDPGGEDDPDFYWICRPA
jgi:predicted TIM-barrel fold metal-dependent hydrolase